MVKGIFKLPLHKLENFLNSVLTLRKIPLKSPTYICISKRSKTLKVKYHLLSRGAVYHVVIDTTNLKVYYEGEWKTRKHD
ncbi:Mobile element protein [Candidatus Enterovibrio escicola]|uniref:Mobile element protein n=1 Tax=Candidatus Enterovibrio escicola TaxID=1927127 RepID=A0A2A5T5L2_9GAMM|nr:Mobile element protein [Candidatus Enterovibrio escacola]